MWTPDLTAIVTAEQKAVARKNAALGAYKLAFDARLDEVAQSRQYDTRLTIVAYLGSTNPNWAAEASAFVAWRDAALAYMFQKLAEVEAGTIEPPTIAEFIAELPLITWPEAT